MIYSTFLIKKRSLLRWTRSDIQCLSNHLGKCHGRHEIPDDPQLRFSDSFSFQAWIYPTTPEFGLQGLVTKWSSSDRSGYGIFVDENGSLAVCIGSENSKDTWVNSGRALRSETWYFVSVVYDSEKGEVRLYQ